MELYEEKVYKPQSTKSLKPGIKYKDKVIKTTQEMQRKDSVVLKTTTGINDLQLKFLKA